MNRLVVARRRARKAPSKRAARRRRRRRIRTDAPMDSDLMAPSTKSARRLQHISCALATVPTAADAESSSGRVIAQISKGERGVPVHLVRQPTSFRPIHVGRNGRLAPGEPQALQAALVEGGVDTESRKVWRGDVGWDDSERKGYTQGDSGLPTRTQELKQLLATFASPQLTRADCTPKGLAAQTEFFHEHGFVIIEDVIQGEALRQAQAAYAAAMAGPLRDWEAQRGGGRRVDEEWFYLEPRKDMYINVPLDYLNNPVLLHILDSPQLIPVVQSVVRIRQASSCLCTRLRTSKPFVANRIFVTDGPR